MDDPTKLVVDIINQLIAFLILITVVIYVWKNRSIVRSSNDIAVKLQHNSEASLQAVALSRQILGEMQNLRNLQTSPVVGAFFLREGSHLYFILQNTGNSLAKNVKYEFTPELMGYGEHNEDEVKQIIWMGGIELLIPPDYQYKTEFGRVSRYIVDSEDFFADLPHQFTIDISCFGADSNELFKFSYNLDLRCPIGDCLQ